MLPLNKEKESKSRIKFYLGAQCCAIKAQTICLCTNAAKTRALQALTTPSTTDCTTLPLALHHQLYLFSSGDFFNRTPLPTKALTFAKHQRLQANHINTQTHTKIGTHGPDCNPQDQHRHAADCQLPATSQALKILAMLYPTFQRTLREHLIAKQALGSKSQAQAKRPRSLNLEQRPNSSSQLVL
jgi:hypothetical protein